MHRERGGIQERGLKVNWTLGPDDHGQTGKKKTWGERDTSTRAGQKENAGTKITPGGTRETEKKANACREKHGGGEDSSPKIPLLKK